LAYGIKLADGPTRSRLCVQASSSARNWSVVFTTI